MSQPTYQNTQSDTPDYMISDIQNILKQYEKRRRITNTILSGCVRAVCVWFDRFWLIVPWQYEQAAWQLSAGSDSNIPAFSLVHFFNIKLVIIERRRNLNCTRICQKNKEGITFRDKTIMMVFLSSCPDDDHVMTTDIWLLFPRLHFLALPMTLFPCQRSPCSHWESRVQFPLILTLDYLEIPTKLFRVCTYSCVYNYKNVY